MSNLTAIKEKQIVVLLDKPRTLRYDLNAYAELEEKYGTVEAAMKALQEGSIRSIRTLLWAGLIHECMDENENYTLTVKQVGAMIKIDDLDRITEAITSAMTDTLPEEDEGESKEGN